MTMKICEKIKKNTNWIVFIIIAVIILFLISFCGFYIKNAYWEPAGVFAMLITGITTIALAGATFCLVSSNIMDRKEKKNAEISSKVIYPLWEDLKEIKKGIPRYVRIQRLIRDIPAQNIEAGTKISNLRQIILEEMKKEGWSCRCIRCREIKAAYDKKERIKIFRKNYPASGGKEMFLSFEDGKRKKLYSILRLRIPSPDSSPIRDLEGAAIIREVHTYGQQLAIKKRGLSPQHRGLGKKLIKKAEEIVKRESDLKKIAVISAVGTRNYYRKLGFRKKGTYLMKRL